MLKPLDRQGVVIMWMENWSVIVTNEMSSAHWIWGFCLTFAWRSAQITCEHPIIEHRKACNRAFYWILCLFHFYIWLFCWDCYIISASVISSEFDIYIYMAILYAYSSIAFNNRWTIDIPDRPHKSTIRFDWSERYKMRSN